MKLIKIVGSRNRLYGLTEGGGLWFRGHHGWEHIPHPVAEPVIDIAFGTIYNDREDRTTEYLHVLTWHGRLFMHDDTRAAHGDNGWVKMDVPK